jgi:lipopolysaccharide exporter
MDLRNKTVKAIKWNFVAAILGAGVGILQLWALSHILPPREYGVIGAALIIVNFFSILSDFGLSASIIRRPLISDVELSSLNLITYSLGVFTFLLTFLSSSWLGSFFDSAEVVTQIRIMSILFLLAPFGQQQRALLAREMRFDLIAITTVINLVVNFVCVISLALLYEKAWVASVAAVASAAVSNFIFFTQGMRERKFSFTFSWTAAKPHIRYCTDLVSDSIINVTSINTFPILMGRLVSLTAIGGYSIANGISLNLIERLKPVLTQALFPAFAKIQDDDAKLAVNFLLVTTYGALINFPMLIGAMIASTAIVSVFFVAEWQFVAGIVKVLCIVGMLRSLDSSVISLLLVKAKMYLNVRVGIPKLLGGIVLAYLLGTKYGLIGIVFSFLIVQAINTLLGYFVMIRSCLPGLGLAYLKSVTIPLFQVLPLFLVSGLLTVFPPFASALANLILVVVSGVIAYGLGLCFSPFAVVRDFVHLAANNVSPRLARILPKLARN